MFLKHMSERVARWSQELDAWVIEDQDRYCWFCNSTGQALSEWLPTFDLALEYLVKSGA